MSNQQQLYLTPEELAIRWATTPGTLSQLRQKKTGPAYHKFGRAVRYHLDDVCAYEELTKKAGYAA